VTHDSAGPPVRYAERLAVPRWWWPAALGVALLPGAEIAMALPGLPGWLPPAVVALAAGAALCRLGRLRVAVADGELRVDDARLPVGFVGAVTVLDPAAKALVLGPHAEPYAFVVQRPWIRGAVLVELDDPADPTPYWVVSSRRPEALATVLRTLAATGRPAVPPADATPR
jgi:hypothetical protein